jgi:hypothetical protein
MCATAADIYGHMFWNLKPLPIPRGDGKSPYPPKCNIKDSYFGFTPNCSKVNKQLLDVIKQKPDGWDSDKIINLIVTKIIPDYIILNNQKPPILAPEWLPHYVDKLNEYYNNQGKGQHLEITDGIINLSDPEISSSVEQTYQPPTDVIDHIALANPDTIAPANPDTSVAPNPENKIDKVINLYNKLSREEQQNVINQISPPEGGSRRKQSKKKRRKHSKRRKQSKRRKGKHSKRRK